MARATTTTTTTTTKQQPPNNNNKTTTINKEKGNKKGEGREKDKKMDKTNFVSLLWVGQSLLEDGRRQCCTGEKTLGRTTCGVFTLKSADAPTAAPVLFSMVVCCGSHFRRSKLGNHQSSVIILRFWPPLTGVHKAPRVLRGVLLACWLEVSKKCILSSAIGCSDWPNALEKHSSEKFQALRGR